MNRSLTGSADAVVPLAADRVWTFVADVRNLGRWVKGMSEVRMTSDKPVGVGSTFSGMYGCGGRIQPLTCEITEFEPSRKMTMRSTTGPFPFEATTRIEAVPGGTRVRQQVTAGSDGAFTTFMFTAMGPVLRWFMKRQIALELVELRKALESGI